MSCKRTVLLLAVMIIAVHLFYSSQLKDSSLRLSVDVMQPKPAPPTQARIQNDILKTLQHLDITAPSETHWEKVSNATIKKTYYARKPHIVYTGIPKAGCTNWKYTILNIELPFPRFPRFQHTHRVPKPRGPIVHEMMQVLGLAYKFPKPAGRMHLNQKFSFTVIRNPWTRMVSGYTDKLQSRMIVSHWGNLTLGILNKYRRKKGERLYLLRDLTKVGGLSLRVTFLEFLKYLADIAIEEVDDHFKPQYKMLGLANVKYDYMGALEHAQIQSKEILKHFKLPGAKSITVLRGSYDSESDPRLESSTLLAKEWFSTVPQGLIDRLYNKYKPDFMIYNYSNFTHDLFPFPLPE